MECGTRSKGKVAIGHRLYDCDKKNVTVGDRRLWQFRNRKGCNVAKGNVTIGNRER